MSLRVKKELGVYKLSGILDVNTSKCLIQHINLLLDYEHKVVINIDGLRLMDQNGVAAFMTIMSFALRQDKMVEISGKGFKDIYDEYRYKVAA
ncbi:MAG: STAS domain-containing protein [Nonlabens sp.]|nr:STAS domain-containing protein [Nonlabens sp.]